jgi:tryptophan synthase alpha chain
MLKFDKPGLVVYLTCGDPNLGVTHEVALAAADSGANVIELGVPFSDPVADGPTIQRASERALASGTDLRSVIRLGARVRVARPNVGLIIFSYLNPIIRYGMEAFARHLADAGIDGALVTDLTLEESGDYVSLMRAHNLATVFLAAPTSPDARLKAIAKASTGFIYAVSRTGVTGTQQSADLKGEAQQLVKRIRKHSKLPVAVGFGISNAKQFHEIGAFADAAVIGSAIVKLIEGSPGNEPEAVRAFIQDLRPVSPR